MKEEKEEDRRKNERLSKDCEDWLDGMEFKHVGGAALVDSFPLLHETDRSREVARAVAARLNAADPATLQMLPYEQTGRVSVSAMKSLKHLIDRMSCEIGPQEIVPGSASEKGMAIDEMLFQNEAADCLSKAGRIVVDLDYLGISVAGTPDAEAFDCPVELKTLETLTPGMSFMPDELYSFFYQHTPFRRLNEWLMQLGMYQIAAEGNGFLVLVSRDTGSVVCYESGPNLRHFPEYFHGTWVREKPVFARLVQDLRRDCSTGAMGVVA